MIKILLFSKEQHQNTKFIAMQQIVGMLKKTATILRFRSYQYIPIHYKMNFGNTMYKGTVETT